MRVRLLGPLLVLALGSPLPAQAPARSLADRVDAVLEEAPRARDSARAAEQLARLGAPALDPIFERLAASSPAQAPRLGALLGAIERMPREQVLAFLGALARSSADERRREVGLDLLACLGERDDLRLALDLGVDQAAEAPPGPALRAALERCLLCISAREPGSLRALAGFFARAAPAARSAIATVLARGGGQDAASLLAGLLGQADEAADAQLLIELAGVGAAQSVVEDLVVFERARGYLGHPRAELVVLACSALDHLADHGAVPDLIVLLEGQAPNVRRAAQAALRGLTGLDEPLEEGGWIAWLDRSLAWWDERAGLCRSALVSGPAPEAAAAIQEVARQRLFLQDVLGLLALALQRPEPDLVRSACRALGAVPERAVRRALEILAAVPDPVVTQDARSALARFERRRPHVSRSIPVLPRTKPSLP